MLRISYNGAEVKAWNQVESVQAFEYSKLSGYTIDPYKDLKSPQDYPEGYAKPNSLYNV